MRNSAEPIPEPFRCRGPRHDLAGGSRDINDGLGGVVECKTMERSIPLGAANGELIEEYQVIRHDGRRSAYDARRSLAHDLPRNVRINQNLGTLRQVE